MATREEGYAWMMAEFTFDHGISIYKPQPMRPLEVICADILELERGSEVAGGGYRLGNGIGKWYSTRTKVRPC